MKRLLTILLFAFALLTAERVSAQYYSWGTDPAELRWRTIRTDDVQIIYPDTVEGIARRTLHYIDRVRPYIDYGFRYPALRLPFVMHPENFRSNGLVMWLPKRVEFLTSPAVESYSMPWCKQLVAHEYRHAVQYNNLNRGVIRVLSWILGQQGSTVGLLFMPTWLIEGDAVMSETEMSSFGRGRQPSFSMEFRAIGNIATSRRNIDKWFCGSYRDNVPDHYHIGYQIASYSYDRYGPTLWSDVAHYAVRNPYVIFATYVGLKKYAGTTVHALFNDTFTDLNRYWDSLPDVDDSARRLRPRPKSYTTYSHPEFLPDGSILALKEDYDRPSRFVTIDPATGCERRLRFTGAVSTRPAAAGGRVWWTEYRRSMLYEQKVGSQLCYMDIDGGKTRTVHGRRNALYPTPTADSLAWIEYLPDGSYHFATADRDVTEASFRRTALPRHKEIHGLAWDDVTRRHYVLVTDDDGMHIARIEPSGDLLPVTPAAYVTLSNLRAGGGKLYYGSIVSGKDEVFVLDLADTARQQRISTSRYGSFQPAASADGRRIAMTVYDRSGYMAAVQTADSLHDEPFAALPADLVNPPRKRWNVINLDTVRYTPADSAASRREHPSKRRRRITHLFNVHSWMPVAFSPFDAVDEHNISLNAGATVMSQNLLSNTEAYASYGYNRAEGSIVRAGLRYYGLGVNLSFDAHYGGNQMFYSITPVNNEGITEYQTLPHPDRYYSVSLGATLPLMLNRGYHTRVVTLSTAWNYSNGMVANVGRITYDPLTHSVTNLQRIGFSEGLHKIVVGAGFSDQVRMAHRDFLPRWGFALYSNFAFNPANSYFSDLVSTYARLYAPGLLPHHSLALEAEYQTSVRGRKLHQGVTWQSGNTQLGYKSSRLIPHGFSSAEISADDYVAASATYRFPLCYPEGGIPSVLYISRIRLGLGVDYAQFNLQRGFTRGVRRLWAYGGEATFDVNFFRMPQSGTVSITLSLYKPSGKPLTFQAGIGMPF
ncbi:MAG: hypothetical protein K2J51_02695 [Alistipes sp.]|nr:hypothetical protein [Alistipes sp.]